MVEISSCEMGTLQEPLKTSVVSFYVNRHDSIFSLSRRLLWESLQCHNAIYLAEIKKALMLAVHSEVHAFSHVIMLCYLATSSALCKWQRLFITPTLKGASVKRRFRGTTQLQQFNLPLYPPRNFDTLPWGVKTQHWVLGLSCFSQKMSKRPCDLPVY